MPALHLGDLTITSSVFEHGGRIPSRHTCEGEDLSPALQWSRSPEHTTELALVCHDPDAPLTMGFTHWIVYGIPPDITGLDEGVTGAFVEGRNSFGELGYRGPAPPPGHGVHHYYFHLYALSSRLRAAPGVSREELLALADAHIMEQARVVGTFSR